MNTQGVKSQVAGRKSSLGSATWPPPPSRSRIGISFPTCDPRPATCNRPLQSGFTLIELLAAITILMIIVSIMATIFTESDRAWRLGTSRADLNTEGRAAIAAIAQDLQYAVADQTLTFVMRPDTARGSPRKPNVSYDLTNSEICFVALLEGATYYSTDTNRNAVEVYYWIRESAADDTTAAASFGRYQLMRTTVNTFEDPLDPSSLNRKAYDNPLNWFMRPSNKGGRDNAGSRGVVAENVALLRFYAPHANGSLTNAYQSWDVVHSNRLPEYVDVVLELLSEEDAQRAAQFAQRQLSSQLGEFLERNVRRFTTRVYFHNRSGYRSRP